MSLSESILTPDELILVTGANGFVGAKTVEKLLDSGFRRLRCFVRPSSNMTRLREVVDRHPGASVDLFMGNLRDPSDCRRVSEGAALVVHLAAGMNGSPTGMFADTVLASRNLLDAVVKSAALKRIVLVSSFAVYQVGTLPSGARISEETPRETHHRKRNDPYSYIKTKQEQLFWKYAGEHHLPLVVLRPGVVFGPYGPEVSPRVGLDVFGLFLHLGGSSLVPLTHVDNCADAIVLAGTRPGIEGQVFNIHDDDLPTSRQFFRRYRASKRNLPSLSVPYPAMLLLSHLLERYSTWSRGQLPAVFTPYKAASLWKGRNYDNGKAKRQLGWSPKVSMKTALDSHFDFIRSREACRQES